jgi:hypothetical protein
MSSKWHTFECAKLSLTAFSSVNYIQGLNGPIDLKHAYRPRAEMPWQPLSMICGSPLHAELSVFLADNIGHRGEK